MASVRGPRAVRCGGAGCLPFASLRVPCGTRSLGPPRNSLHSLRSFRSNRRGESDDEARGYARGQETCAPRRRIQRPRSAPPSGRARSNYSYRSMFGRIGPYRAESSTSTASNVMSVTRSGSVVVLGAGASAEAGYPTAVGLLTNFRHAVAAAATRDADRLRRTTAAVDELQKQPLDPKTVLQWVAPQVPQTPIDQWFDNLWLRYKTSGVRGRPLALPRTRKDGRPDIGAAVIGGVGGGFSFADYSAPRLGPRVDSEPYLEDFFSFYDSAFGLGTSLVVDDLKLPAAAAHKLRRLRDLAIEVAFRSLSVHDKAEANYLRPVFGLLGPTGNCAPIATLNFDHTIEQVALRAGVNLFDGFRADPDHELVDPWHGADPGAAVLWSGATDYLVPYVGFSADMAHAAPLLKLHGSLGWFAFAEGGGDIGHPPLLRNNTPYGHFRVSRFATCAVQTGEPFDLDAIALGGQVRPNRPQRMTRKAGQLWLRPFMSFAMAAKVHTDPLSLELLWTFTRYLRAARTIVVIGYSWSDVHINEMLLSAMAQGASLVNIGLRASDTSVRALLMQRFPSTFSTLASRTYCFGGGARACLEQGTIELSEGEIRRLDLVQAINGGMPAGLSLADQLRH
jgi:hypothetical protein